MPRYGIKQRLNPKNWVFLVRLQVFHFALDQGFRLPLIHGAFFEVVKEAILHVQQELRKEADWSLEVWKLQGTLGRIEVFLFLYTLYTVIL